MAGAENFGLPPGLMISDGTEAGTRRIQTYTGFAPLNTIGLTILSDRFYFSDFFSLWQSDGTPQGTVTVPGMSRPKHLIRAGSRLYFQAHHPDTGTELWAIEVSSLFPGA